MPEQPQWPERTLDMPPQDPWADQPTAQAVPPGAAVPPDPSPFSRGRASVTPRTAQFQAEHEPTGVGWPGAGAPAAQHREFSWRELRRGGEWTTAGLLFAFVCWGIWVISTSGDLTTAVIVFVSSLLVAAGLFALCRLVGRQVLEKQFGRVRRSAKASHVVTAIFLVGVGVAHLRQTGWVVDAWNWVIGLF
ncbi:DNA-directed RNA polymerase II [Actinoplanes sp. NPDC049265]|uniref:DNA-directed RNA polymerase II n=1 Tax=Actinoplanes sp. NPDC049265 TaxID=3363902 RepID=UPI0037152FE9